MSLFLSYTRMDFQIEPTRCRRFSLFAAFPQSIRTLKKTNRTAAITLSAIPLVGFQLSSVL